MDRFCGKTNEEAHVGLVNDLAACFGLCFEGSREVNTRTLERSSWGDPFFGERSHFWMGLVLSKSMTRYALMQNLSDVLSSIDDPKSFTSLIQRRLGSSMKCSFVIVFNYQLCEASLDA